MKRPPLTTNQAWQSHWRKRSDAKKQVEETVGWLARQAGLKDLGPSVVSITWYAPDRRNRDSDSLAEFQKGVLDGLVKVGVWPDDHSDYVIQTRLAVTKAETRNPRIEIRIWEVDDTRIEMVGTG
ncbi:RusA family crossover junction endodeoxyribonuclease [Mycolicibacterium sphagni]|uniref:RusA-like resolvase n=1 Tax=Mycolicibacterium sphagni TaxID=1786 RepID=A0A255DQZ5_9MYCO|nr:hypothetical protein CG716_05075 [Mycolicibacterium sphagni]